MNTEQLKAYMVASGIRARSGNWRDYEKGKRAIDGTARPPEEYDQLILWLAEYLNV